MFVISANINLHIADILKPSFFDLFAKNYFTISQKNRISFLKIIRIRKVLGLMFVISANINMLIAVILSPKSSRYDFPELRYGFHFP
jgi:sensor histidine kinase YesM